MIRKAIQKHTLEKLAGYQVSYASKRKLTNKPFRGMVRIRWYGIKFLQDKKLPQSPFDKISLF